MKENSINNWEEMTIKHTNWMQKKPKDSGLKYDNKNNIMLTFPSAPPPRAHLPQGYQAKVNLLLRGKTQLTDFSQISPNPQRTLPVHDVIHSPWSYPLTGIFTLTSVNNTSSPRARQNLRSSLHLTNPCAKRNVHSITKPKGRIYKTKPLCHYITRDATVTFPMVCNI